jgi:hypothetical protein
MIRGSVVVHRRRCGKRNCRCAAGDLREATVLSYSERGRDPVCDAAASRGGRGALIARLARGRGGAGPVAASVDEHSPPAALFDSTLGFLDGAQAASRMPSWRPSLKPTAGSCCAS